MTAELGGQTGLCDPDETTAAFIRAAGAEPGDIAHWQSDADAVPAERHRFDAAALDAAGRGAAQPRQCRAGRRTTARSKIDVAHIGACTGAKLVDLRMAASVLKGRKVASGRVAAGRAGLAPRSGGGGERRHAADPDRRRRDAAAERLRHVRRLQRHAGGERDLHLLDRAQLQGPHGHRRAPTSISARPTRSRRPPCAAASPIRARCCHERAAITAAPSSSATASTPTCWRPASI